MADRMWCPAFAGPSQRRLLCTWASSPARAFASRSSTAASSRRIRTSAASPAASASAKTAACTTTTSIALGHGTAVTAAIREKAPDAEIIAIKVFWRALTTDIATLVRAIDEAAARGADVINLSLGTSKMQHRDLLEAAVARARTQGALIVAANDDGGVRWLPGCLDDVVAVRADWTCERDAYAIDFVEDRPVLSTSPYPRDIPGVSRERNVNGVSFAVANAARIRRACARSGTAHAGAARGRRSREFSPRSKQAAGMQRSPAV